MSTAYTPVSCPRREPTPEEIKAESAEIDKLDIAIAELHEKIVSLQSQLEALRKERNQHRMQRRKHKSIITLARRIPEELLIMIFQYCTTHGPPPNAVSQICTAWHCAASAPSFWSHIQVNLHAADPVGKTRYWLSKAAHVPLHIELSCWAGDSNRTVLLEKLVKVLDILTPCMSQWFRFTANGYADAQSLILSACASGMPTNLECVHFCTGLDFVETVKGPNGDILVHDVFRQESAPKLDRCEYLGLAPPPSTIFPSHIRQLVLKTSGAHRTPVGAYVRCLSNLANLEILVIHHQHRPLDQPSGEIKPVWLPNLTHLIVNGFADNNGMLAHLVVPSLRCICLNSDCMTATYVSLLVLLANSSPPLEILDIHSCHFSNTQFATLLSHLTHLRELRLTLSRTGMDDEVMFGLLERHHGFCPQLSHLYLLDCSDVHGEALLKMLRTRNSGDDTPIFRPGRGEEGALISKPIEEVVVCSCEQITEEHMLEVASMTVCGNAAERKHRDYTGAVDWLKFVKLP